MPWKRGKIILPEHTRQIRTVVQLLLPSLPTCCLGHLVFAFGGQPFLPLGCSAIAKPLNLIVLLKEVLYVGLVVHLSHAKVRGNTSWLLTLDLRNEVKIRGPESVGEAKTKSGRRRNKDLNILCSD